MAEKDGLDLFAASEIAASGFCERSLKIGSFVVAENVCLDRLSLHCQEDASGILLPRLRPSVDTVENRVDLVFGHDGYCSEGEAAGNPFRRA
jgi:hypothetical protein